MAVSETPAVLIPHPTEELQLIKFQKKIIETLFEKDRIMYSQLPLWIPLETKPAVIKEVCFAAPDFSDKLIFIPVTVCGNDFEIKTTLPLVHLHSGRPFSKEDIKKIPNLEIKKLKIFRLGIEKELSSNSKCITDSKWIKVR